jgi:hypothetical protein
MVGRRAGHHARDQPASDRAEGSDGRTTLLCSTTARRIVRCSEINAARAARRHGSRTSIPSARHRVLTSPPHNTGGAAPNRCVRSRHRRPRLEGNRRVTHSHTLCAVLGVPPDIARRRSALRAGTWRVHNRSRRCVLRIGGIHRVSGAGGEGTARREAREPAASQARLGCAAPNAIAGRAIGRRSYDPDRGTEERSDGRVGADPGSPRRRTGRRQLERSRCCTRSQGGRATAR